MLSVVDLQVPVLGGESDFGRLEAQLLCMQTHLAHLRDVEVRLCLLFFRNLYRLNRGSVLTSKGRLRVFYQCLQGLQGASEAIHGQIQDAIDNIDKKLLRMFQSAVKAEKVVRALEVASQLTAVRSLEGAVKLANHHR